MPAHFKDIIFSERDGDILPHTISTKVKKKKRIKETKKKKKEKKSKRELVSKAGHLIPYHMPQII